MVVQQLKNVKHVHIVLYSSNVRFSVSLLVTIMASHGFTLRAYSISFT